MNKELFIKSINEDLEKLRQNSEPFFTADDIIFLLNLLARYSRSQTGSSVINLTNRLDLLIGDLKNFGEKDAYLYIENFVKNNWS
ncbi:hypothetical protein YZ82_00765 [Campylobacter hyointestinalis]|uniref:Uncharacterized protein n=1 Tax=Campylobacter hyointestinalis TaxID=198 RepID=A0A562XLT6_CAMHY|nr:hypothetical protein [Campylobacter hyointestinalis]RAZ51698.1 hypothetical protein CHL10075_05815 [Campylobacter hyointestinalis subsp. lawsonii]TWO23104.1 hypothetical protein YZ82_00765 [Campylobacter hyointestinalis]